MAQWGNDGAAPLPATHRGMRTLLPLWQPVHSRQRVLVPPQLGMALSAARAETVMNAVAPHVAACTPESEALLLCISALQQEHEVMALILC